MKKGVLTFGILVLLMAGTGLWGCGRNREQSDSPILIEPSKKIQTEETTLYEPQIFTQKEAVLSEELSQGVESETTLEPLATEENPDSFPQLRETSDESMKTCLVKDLGGDFAFLQLNEEERELYRTIYRILASASDKEWIPSTDPAQIDRVFNHVMLDHPELFYVTGYSYTKHSVKSETQSIDFGGTYTMSREEIEKTQCEIENTVEQIVNEVSGCTDYETVKYFYEWIILNTEYDMEAAEHQNVVSVFLNHRSVCQGYAKALQYLLLSASKKCVMVSGHVNAVEGHAWVLAELDGAYYYVDPTWGDASYTTKNPNGSAQVPEINYDYLCVTTKQIEMTHTIESILELPECTEMTNNYYIKEDAYFKRLDYERLERLFETGYEQQKKSVTIKCSDTQVYEEICEYLLDEGHIFDYLKRHSGKISYIQDEKQESVCFMLY